MGISEFIRDIEDDSDLAFKIEEFSMRTGASTSELQATFICKNIPIEGISSLDTSANSASNTNQNTTNNTNSNTTNSTSTNTTNTTNTTNSTNS